MSRGRIALTLAVLGLAFAAGPATANFHLIKIREIRAAPSPFVELQMYAPGQTQLLGHKVTTYTASGAPLSNVPLSNVSMGDNQRTVLVAPATVDGVAPDITGPMTLSAPGGAVCFDAIPVDCVAYGAFTGAASLPGIVGTPFAAYPDANGALSLTRSIAPGCATLLEASDDTDSSAADFSVTAATPRNNSTTPTETTCDGGGGGGGGGGGSADTNPPQTEITKAPKAKTTKTTAKFKFRSSEPGSTFECKLDKGAFKNCDSPRKYKHLDPGKHKFKVAATDAAGNTDRSPAKAKFKVLSD